MTLQVVKAQLRYDRILYILAEGGGSGSNLRLEHPRCGVMVEVLDQYSQVQRRLEPYLAQYHRAMATDPTFSEAVSQIDIFLNFSFVVGIFYTLHLCPQIYNCSFMQSDIITLLSS